MAEAKLSALHWVEDPWVVAVHHLHRNSLFLCHVYEPQLPDLAYGAGRKPLLHCLTPKHQSTNALSPESQAPAWDLSKVCHMPVASELWQVRSLPVLLSSQQILCVTLSPRDKMCMPDVGGAGHQGRKTLICLLLVAFADKNNNTQSQQTLNSSHLLVTKNTS